MTAVFTAEEILEICSGRLAFGMMPDEAGAIKDDTRRLAEGEWFLALPGNKYDGHDFIGDAFSAGALGAIVEERAGYAVSNPQFPLLAVEDTFLAYRSLAFNWRRRINPRLALVVGSKGRKIAHACMDLFGAYRRFYYGDERDISAALLAMPYDAQAAVVEIELRELLFCDHLIKSVRPNLLIMPEQESQELTRLDSESAIASAQIRLLAELDASKCVVISEMVKDDVIETAAFAAHHLGLSESEISQGLDQSRSGDKIS